MYDKDILMLQVGGSQTGFSHILYLLYLHNVVIYDPPHKLFTVSCFQNGPQPLPHADLVEIWALWLLQWELFKQRPGEQHLNNHSEKRVVVLYFLMKYNSICRMNWHSGIVWQKRCFTSLSSSLVQSTNQTWKMCWSDVNHTIVSDQCCVSRWALCPRYQSGDQRGCDNEGGYPPAVHWAHGS